MAIKSKTRQSNGHTATSWSSGVTQPRRGHPAIGSGDITHLCSQITTKSGQIINCWFFFSDSLGLPSFFSSSSSCQLLTASKSTVVHQLNYSPLLRFPMPQLFMNALCLCLLLSPLDSTCVAMTSIRETRRFAAFSPGAAVYIRYIKDLTVSSVIYSVSQQ